MIIKEKGRENKYKYIYVYVRNCFVDSSRNDVPNFVGTIVAAVSFMLFIRPFCFSSKKKRKKQTSKQKQKQYFFLPFLLSVLANVNYFFPKSYTQTVGVLIFPFPHAYYVPSHTGDFADALRMRVEVRAKK